MKRNTPTPVKLFTFAEMMQDAMQKQKEAERIFNTGMCTARNAKGNPCKRPHTGSDGYCDKCRNEINALLAKLSKDKGFVQMQF